MRLILIAASVLSMQAAPIADYYTFKADTTWTYKRVENGAERKIAAKVLSNEGGKLKLDWKEYEKDGGLHDSNTITWSLIDGVLTAEARKEGDDNALVFGVLKDGAKKDDRWTTALGEFVHHGTVELTVPAGTYKNAIKTRLSLGDEGKIDFYLVPKVGLVKIDIHGEGPNTFELSEFKEPKK